MDRRVIDRHSGAIVRERTWERLFNADFDAGFVTLC